MAGPGRTLAGPTTSSSSSPASYARYAKDTLLAEQNRPILKAVGFFAAGVAFLHSSWGSIISFQEVLSG